MDNRGITDDPFSNQLDSVFKNFQSGKFHIHIDKNTGALSKQILDEGQKQNLDTEFNNKVLLKAGSILRGKETGKTQKRTRLGRKREKDKVDQLAQKVASRYEKLLGIEQSDNQKKDKLARRLDKLAIGEIKRAAFKDPDKITHKKIIDVEQANIERNQQLIKQKLNDAPELASNFNPKPKIKNLESYLKLQAPNSTLQGIGRDIDRYFMIDKATSCITLSDTNEKDVFRSSEIVKNASDKEIVPKKFKAALQYYMAHLELTKKAEEGQTKAEEIMDALDERLADPKGGGVDEKIMQFIMSMKEGKVGGENGPKIAKFFTLFSQKFLQTAQGIEVAPGKIDLDLPHLKHNQQSLQWTVNIDKNGIMTAEMAIDFVNNPTDEYGNPIRVDDFKPMDHEPEHKIRYVGVFKADIHDLDSGELEINIEQKALDNEGVEAESIRYLLNELGFEIDDIHEMSDEDKKIKFS